MASLIKENVFEFPDLFEGTLLGTKEARGFKQRQTIQTTIDATYEEVMAKQLTATEIEAIKGSKEKVVKAQEIIKK